MNVEDVTPEYLVRLATTIKKKNYRILWHNTNSTEVHISGDILGDYKKSEEDLNHLPGIIVLPHFDVYQSQYFNTEQKREWLTFQEMLDEVINYEVKNNPKWRKLLEKLKLN